MTDRISSYLANGAVVFLILVSTTFGGNTSQNKSDPGKCRQFIGSNSYVGPNTGAQYILGKNIERPDEEKCEAFSLYIVAKHGISKSIYLEQIQELLKLFETNGEITSTPQFQEKDELLEEGKYEIYNIGKMLAEKFPELKPSPKNFQVYTPDTDKTELSAQKFTAGFLKMDFNSEIYLVDPTDAKARKSTRWQSKDFGRPYTVRREKLNPLHVDFSDSGDYESIGKAVNLYSNQQHVLKRLKDLFHSFLLRVGVQELKKKFNITDSNISTLEEVEIKVGEEEVRKILGLKDLDKIPLEKQAMENLEIKEEEVNPEEGQRIAGQEKVTEFLKSESLDCALLKKDVGTTEHVRNQVMCLGFKKIQKVISPDDADEFVVMTLFFVLIYEVYAIDKTSHGVCLLRPDLQKQDVDMLSSWMEIENYYTSGYGNEQNVTAAGKTVLDLIVEDINKIANSSGKAKSIKAYFTSDGIPQAVSVALGLYKPPVAPMGKEYDRKLNYGASYQNGSGSNIVIVLYRCKEEKSNKRIIKADVYRNYDRITKYLCEEPESVIKNNEGKNVVGRGVKEEDKEPCKLETLLTNIKKRSSRFENTAVLDKEPKKVTKIGEVENLDAHGGGQEDKEPSKSETLLTDIKERSTQLETTGMLGEESEKIEEISEGEDLDRHGVGQEGKEPSKSETLLTNIKERSTQSETTGMLGEESKKTEGISESKNLDRDGVEQDDKEPSKSETSLTKVKSLFQKFVIAVGLAAAITFFLTRLRKNSS